MAWADEETKNEMAQCVHSVVDASKELHPEYVCGLVKSSCVIYHRNPYDAVIAEARYKVGKGPKPKNEPFCKRYERFCQ